MNVISSKKPGLIRRFALAFCLCTTLSAAAIVTIMPSQAHAQDAMRTFFDRGGFNYCDAKLLGAYWGMDVTRAKVEGGQKILASGNQGISNVKAALQASRGARNKCVWGDTQLSYRDAEKLAGYWGTSTPYDAKLKAADFYTNGRPGIVTNILASN
ncbi:MAG: hypothetical protein HKP56_16035 [Anderseniella sp.]|nr:hypothetical protein [Anderseniella sp.]